MTTDNYALCIDRPYAVGRVILTCPRCFADRGLRFTTNHADVTGACGCGHTWREDRILASAVRARIRELQRESVL